MSAHRNHLSTLRTRRDAVLDRFRKGKSRLKGKRRGFLSGRHDFDDADLLRILNRQIDNASLEAE